MRRFRKIKTTDQGIELLQSNLKDVFDSLEAEPFVGAKALGYVTLKTGVNIISHGLGKGYVSCLLSPPSTNFAILEETNSPDRTKYIAITASAPATVQIWALTAAIPGIFNPASPAASVPNSAQGWVTVLDLDFTIQPGQTLTTDGNYTIAGLTFVKGNSAHDRVALALTNGTGLVIKPATSSYDAATRNLPYIWLALTQLPGVTWDWTTQIRIFIDEVDGSSVASDVAFMGIDTNSNAWAMLVYRGHGTSATAIAQKMIINATDIFSNENTLGALDHTTETTLLMWNYGSALIGAQYSVFAGESYYTAPGWPATNACNPWHVSDAPNFSSDKAKFVGTAPAPGGLGIFLGASGGAGTSGTFTYKRIRVDVR